MLFQIIEARFLNFRSRIFRLKTAGRFYWEQP